MATRFPDRITIVRRGTAGGQPVMVVDGEEFPYFTSDGYHVDVTRSDTPTVTLTIPCARLEVINDVSHGSYIVAKGAMDADAETVHDAVLAEALAVGA